MANGENLTVEQRLLALQLLDKERERLEGRKRARSLDWTKQIASAQVVQHERIQAALPRTVVNMRDHLIEIQSADSEIEEWKKERKAEIQKLDKEIGTVLLAIHEVLHLGKSVQTELPFAGVGETLEMSVETLEVVTHATAQVIEDDDYAGEANEEQTKILHARLQELRSSVKLPPTDADLADAVSEESEVPELAPGESTEELSDGDLLSDIGWDESADPAQKQ